jgi:hypothetical protein
MRTWFLVLLAATPLLAGAEASCGCSTAKISKAVLTRGVNDGQPVDEVTSFKTTDTTLHLLVRLSHAPPDTELSAVWSVVDAGGVRDLEIDRATVKTGDFADFTLTKDDGWPPGKYRVTVSMNGKEAKTLDFQVQ